MQDVGSQDSGIVAVLSAVLSADAHVSFFSVLIEVLCFFATFAVIREIFKRQGAKKKPIRPCKKLCEEEPSAGQRELPPIHGWRQASKLGPVSGQELQTWAAKVFAANHDSFVDEFTSYFAKHRGNTKHRGTANALLDIPAKAGRPDLVQAFAEAVKTRAGFEVDASCLHQANLSALAAKGLTQEVEEIWAKEREEAGDQRIALRSFAGVVRGYLKSGKLREAIAKLDEMRSYGHEVPSSAMAELGRAACASGADLIEVLSWLDGKLVLPKEALSVMLDHCSRADDLKTAARLKELSQASKVGLPEDGYESLLKLYSKVNDASGLEALAEMQAVGYAPCEGLCRFVMARCAESKNIALAEALAEFLRQRQEMTFATYKTLMKVYAYASLYDKACDIYTEITALGMEPDSVMCGSLLKFAVKAGRTALMHEIFDKADSSCVQNYMWLIRAAGQEGDVERALSIFRKLQETQPGLVDVMAFNIAIDACASNKDMVRAKELVEEMRPKHACNIVTFNTLMKGYTAAGDIKTARSILHEMEAAGVAPDSASFSCLLGGALRLGHFTEAWGVIEEMDRRSIAPDSYVVSIMMQATRKATNARDADRLLTMLDRPDVKICEDEVVFNTVLDACIFRRDHKRLMLAIDAYTCSSVRPSVRTYGLLIKACSLLKRTVRCWSFWKEMVDERGILPNDVTLGCMIDALVEAQEVDDALALFQDWKSKVKCDTIIYSTLIKGFASIGDSERAAALYTDMKKNGVQLNHIVFTALINAYTRSGCMSKAEALFEDMKREGCEPNAITYSSLVKGHCVRGDLEAALVLFHQMLELGFQADAVIFNTLLHGCVDKANWSLGDELIHEMARLGVQPTNYTLSILVKMWSKRGELDKAFEAVYTALRDPMTARRVDAQVGACIVGACIHNRSPDRALAIFEEMKSWRGFDGPDANTYSALISGLPRFGYLRKAVQLAEEACSTLSATSCGRDRRPLAPNALQQLFRSMKQEGVLQELGFDLERRLRKAGMKVDAQWLA